MRRTTWKQIGLGAVAALLAVGCASGTPQRSPGGTAGNTVQGTTTGDLDACSVALGNASNLGTGAGARGTTGTTGVPGDTGTTVGGAPGEPTANGLMIGNVALVALPTHDNMPTTGTTGATGTAAPGGGTTTTPGATGVSPAGNPTALDRIRGACRGVTEIRIVTDAGDRTRLAQIAMAMRKGSSIGGFMDDISGIAKRATIAGGGTSMPPGHSMAPGQTMAPTSP